MGEILRNAEADKQRYVCFLSRFQGIQTALNGNAYDRWRHAGGSHTLPKEHACIETIAQECNCAVLDVYIPQPEQPNTPDAIILTDIHPRNDAQSLQDIVHSMLARNIINNRTVFFVEGNNGHVTTVVEQNGTSAATVTNSSLKRDVICFPPAQPHILTTTLKDLFNRCVAIDFNDISPDQIPPAQDSYFQFFLRNIEPRAIHFTRAMTGLYTTGKKHNVDYRIIQKFGAADLYEGTYTAALRQRRISYVALCPRTSAQLVPDFFKKVCS